MAVEAETKNPGRVRLSFDISPELRRRVRYAALRRDETLTEFLTAVVAESLEAGPVEDDGCARCGSFSHASGECDSEIERR